MIDHFILHDMLAVVKQINPDYPADTDIDYMPLNKIATFIVGQIKGQQTPIEFMLVWEHLYSTAYNDPFYRDKSLTTISNHIQEFFQKAKNGNGKISGAKLQQKLAARINKRK